MNSYITSPNDWLNRAGARYENGNLILPFSFLLVPMGLASEALEEFKKTDVLNERIKHGLVIATMIRIADTAYFKNVAKMIMDNSKESGVVICEHCIRGQIWPNKMKDYRQAVNKRLIHKMEDGLPVNNEDLEFVEKYYDEMFKHPLVNPISLGNIQGLSFCEKHIPKKDKQK